VACYTFEQELHQAFRERISLQNRDRENLPEHMVAYMGIRSNSQRVRKLVGILEPYPLLLLCLFVRERPAHIQVPPDSVKKDPGFITGVKEFCQQDCLIPRRTFQESRIDIADKTFWDRGLDEVENASGRDDRSCRKLGKI